MKGENTFTESRQVNKSGPWSSSHHITGAQNGSEYMPTLKRKRVVLTTFMFLAGLLQGGLEHSPVEAALEVYEVVMAEERSSPEISGQEAYLNVPASDGGRELLGERLFPHNPQTSVSPSENATRLQLKSPGKLPGIELGVEMHSLQAFQSVIPPENLPEGWDFKQEQPLLLRPSVNDPDYNGGFLKFTW